MPGAPNVLELVHRSCAEVAALHAEHVRIDEGAVAALARELVAAAEDVRGSVRGLLLPIKFSSLEQELTLLTLYHLLDFGSGFDPLLRRQGKEGAREALMFGLMGMHLAGTRLDAHKLKSFTMYDIHQVFGIDATVEVPVMPGVTMSKPGPLQPYCKLLLAALTETGQVLSDSGVRTPGELVLGIAEGLHKAGRCSASAFVEELVDTVPAFRDSVLYDGSTLTLHRRAQNLAADLAAVYGGRDERLAFPDLDRLAADSGATTIAVLRSKGALVLSEELAATIDGRKELPAGPHERALRAAAVAAVDRVVAAAAAGGAAGGGADPAAAATTATAETESEAATRGGEPAEGSRGEAASSAAGVAAAGAGGVTGGERHEGTSGGSGGGLVLRAVDVGAYLAFLTEEGRELHGKVTPHLTPGLMAY
ncbi:hypothetical protein GPECTOR_14g70 [Gonium pectorale]|uniref:Queuosine 5'-phosphate N-glycosylase/hydrolase n=1 Tax=Gonium pectorale TaxID=33097 RepID=A0A150GMQ0_GONPE|nr:hypothetical protein GPECTOR_14g70 [Gonium pectorale]|eukprot:KXZ51087.1 hypothetical protein GPECTOR_14g70 [Gonium pectorale]